MRRYFTSALLSAALISVAAPLAAQKVITLQDSENVAENPCDLVSQGSLVIAPDGNLTVTVADLEACLGTTDALNVSPILVIPDPVVAGTSLEVLWASVGAVSCQPQVTGAGDLPGWTSQNLGLQGPVSFIVPVSTTAGSYSVGVSCSDGETLLSQSTSIQVNAPDLGDPPPPPNLTVNGSAIGTGIAPGDTLTVAWSSTDADGCFASGTFPGWSGSKNVTGNEGFTNTGSLPVDTQYTVQLSCSNAAGSSTLVSRTVSIQDSGELPAGCESRPLLGYGSLSNWVRKTTGGNSCVWNRLAGTVDQTADCRFFGDRTNPPQAGVWPNPWPGSQNTRNLTIFGNSGRQFIAMAFNTGNIPQNHLGRMTQEVPQFAGANGGFKLWSISKCPGDYNAALIEDEMGPGCVWREFGSVTESFRWGGFDQSIVNDTTRCALQPNTDYYFNIIWSSDQPGTPPEQITPFTICQTERCGMNATPAGIYFP